MPTADMTVRSNVIDDRRYLAGITGTGAANPTKRHGDNVLVTRQAVGVFRFSFPTFPGAFKHFRSQLRATAPAAVKQCTITAADFVAATLTVPTYIDLSVWDSAGAARDLAAAEFLDVEFIFAAMGG